MAENKRSAIQIEDDRRRIADLYLKGWTQSAIAQEIGVSQPQISYDLGVIRQQWRATTTINLDEAKLKELSRIDLLERTYWEAWTRSLDEKVKTRTERYAGSDKQGKASVEKETLLGNPSYLAGVQWCISERCKVLGLYAPVKQEHSGVGGDAITVKFIDYRNGIDTTET